MMINLNKKERMLLIGMTLACSVILSIFYFFIYSPQEKRQEMKQKELETEQKLLTAIETKVSEIADHSYRNSTSMQKQIPVSPLTEQLLLQFEKAEVVSDSTILSMSFAKEDFILPTEEAEDAPLENQEGSTGEQVAETVTTPVKRLLVTMTVESDNYFSMEKFINSLENLERIVEVNQLAFEGKEELGPVLNEEGPQPITYQLVASAFYLPELTDLKDGIPSFDSPPPSLKKDPFIQYLDPASAEGNENDPR
ncbi:hypothetical protein QTG56_11925 [Rossellomorea sp. AcN35-11]|nr:hypothetical protein [Rossellomorea aquimaris]WJV27886.1 hypothetical protein QTG56_11925 [Rossellomorea sp. AcN35-11]